MINYSKLNKKRKKELAYLPESKKKNATCISEQQNWGLELLSVPSVWHFTKGAGIKVAVLDTGVEQDHPDLEPNIIEAVDFTASSSGPRDTDGHGTHVAGIIAARANGFGVIGVAPEAELYCAKVVDNGFSQVKWIIDALDWAIKQKVDIISMSLRMISYNKEFHDKIKEAINKHNIFVICASGDNGPFLDTLEYPGKFPETIAVGAIKEGLGINHFSSRGELVDVVAPGEDILSTYINKSYFKLSGTSMAAPFVSGIVALMLAKHRDLDPEEKQIKSIEELRRHLKKICIDLGPEGKDSTFGNGLIDPIKLLNLNGLINPVKTLNSNNSHMKDFAPYFNLKKLDGTFQLNVLISLPKDIVIDSFGDDVPYPGNVLDRIRYFDLRLKKGTSEAKIHETVPFEYTPDRKIEDSIYIKISAVDFAFTAPARVGGGGAYDP